MAAALSLVVVLALLAAPSSADEAVWSSVSFIYHGERTPLRASYPALTPVGAQLMLAQGSLYRARYLDNSTLSPSQNVITTHAPIQGIESQALVNPQLTILSTTDEYVATGALAFMQGLYPPRNMSFADENGGMESAVLSNHSVIDFPLGGYQYPNIDTVSTTDPSYTW